MTERTTYEGVKCVAVSAREMVLFKPDGKLFVWEKIEDEPPLQKYAGADIGKLIGKRENASGKRRPLS